MDTWYGRKKHLGLEELSPRKKITLNRFFFVKIQDMCVQILVFFLVFHRNIF